MARGDLQRQRHGDNHQWRAVERGTGSARGKSAGTYRGAKGKTGRGTPLDLALTAEGAPFEGRRCHDGRVPLRVFLPRLHQYMPPNR